MFVVVALAANLEYRYRSRKAALAKFERLVMDHKDSTISVVHSTRRIDEVIAFWSWGTLHLRPADQPTND